MSPRRPREISDRLVTDVTRQKKPCFLDRSIVVEFSSRRSNKKVDLFKLLFLSYSTGCRGRFFKHRDIYFLDVCFGSNERNFGGSKFGGSTISRVKTFRCYLKKKISFQTVVMNFKTVDFRDVLNIIRSIDIFGI